jgi:hypothetical protein
MSAFEVYLILKLDLLVFALYVAGLLAMLCAYAAAVGDYAIAENCESPFIFFGGMARMWRSRLKAAVFSLGFLALILAALLPSTREAAMMWAAPRLTSAQFAKDTLPADLRELYDKGMLLLKDRLAGGLEAKKKRGGE